MINQMLQLLVFFVAGPLAVVITTLYLRGSGAMVASRVTLVTHGFSDFHGAKFNDMSEAIKLVPLAA